MKKEQIIYNNQIVGYIDNVGYQDGMVNIVNIYLFKSNFFTEIVNKIKKSSLSKLNDEEFIFDLKDDYLTIKNKKHYEKNN